MNEPLKQFLRRFQIVLLTARRWRQAKACGKRFRETKRFVYSRQFAAYLRTHELRKLQVGSGPHLLPGWLNTDFEPVSREFVFLDATKPFPLPEAAFDYIFTEHMIEHVSYPHGTAMLRECFRVLKPGGRIRIATPNLRNLVALYAPTKTEFQREYIARVCGEYYPDLPPHECYVLNVFFRNWGHQFIYDPPALRRLLETVGFREVTEQPVGESPDPNLHGLESHGQLIGEACNRLETMVLEAQRPLPTTAAANSPRPTP